MLKYKIPQIVTLIHRNPATWGTYLDIFFYPPLKIKKGHLYPDVPNWI